ncbi:MAG: nitroreductase family deazaflavin-dependent oxidoreductase [Gaiella sp.]
MPKALSLLHVMLYRLLGGRLVGRVGKAPVLLLTTRGRKSGKSRTVPLLYLHDGDTFVVVASNGGARSHPGWFFNVEAAGGGSVRIGRRRLEVSARTASPEERERLWPAIVPLYKGYEAYQARTAREIPLVVLTPA